MVQKLKGIKAAWLHFDLQLKNQKNTAMTSGSELLVQDRLMYKGHEDICSRGIKWLPSSSSGSFSLFWPKAFHLWLLIPFSFQTTELRLFFQGTWYLWTIVWPDAFGTSCRLEIVPRDERGSKVEGQRKATIHSLMTLWFILFIYFTFAVQDSSRNAVCVNSRCSYINTTLNGDYVNDCTTWFQFT